MEGQTSAQPQSPAPSTKPRHLLGSWAPEPRAPGIPMGALCLPLPCSRLVIQPSSSPGKGMLLPQPSARLGTGARGAPLTWSLPSEEHTGSSRAPPAGLASALTATFAPSLSHPCPSVPSRQPRTVPARRHLWSQCRTGAQTPIHLSWGAKRD